MIQIYDLDGKPRAWGKVEIIYGELKDIYQLNKEGRPNTTMDYPDNCRVVHYNQEGQITLDGRVRGNTFKPAGRFRELMGKEISLNE